MTKAAVEGLFCFHQYTQIDRIRLAGADRELRIRIDKKIDLMMEKMAKVAPRVKVCLYH